jgi:hypothetical protein
MDADGGYAAGLDGDGSVRVRPKRKQKAHPTEAGSIKEGCAGFEIPFKWLTSGAPSYLSLPGRPSLFEDWDGAVHICVRISTADLVFFCISYLNFDRHFSCPTTGSLDFFPL